MHFYLMMRINHQSGSCGKCSHHQKQFLALLEMHYKDFMECIVWVSCNGDGERKQKHLLGIQIFNFVEENDEYLSQSYLKAEAGTGKRTNGFELVLFVN